MFNKTPFSGCDSSLMQKTILMQKGILAPCRKRYQPYYLPGEEKITLQSWENSATRSIRDPSSPGKKKLDSTQWLLTVGQGTTGCYGVKHGASRPSQTAEHQSHRKQQSSLQAGNSPLPGTHLRAIKKGFTGETYLSMSFPIITAVF